jgi:Ca-activated chloride channel homolog
VRERVAARASRRFYMASNESIGATERRRAPALVSVDGRTYPLRSALIRGRAEGGLAQTTLIQEFHNPHAEPLEVLYTMPLPADGAVLAYTIRMGERVIRGEIQLREKAEAAYREALYSGRSAGLLEQDRADTFQQRLGNVPPHTDVQVEIDVLHPLAFLAAVDDAGPLWEYRFPTVVSVRYQGAPGRVPDKDRLDVDRAGAP